MKKVDANCHPRRLKERAEQFLRTHNSIKKNKKNTVLSWLITSSECGCKSTRFDAEWIGDHTLNSSISTLSNSYSLTVNRELTKVPTRFNGLVDCKRYWLDSEGIDKAKRLLGIKKAT